NVIVSNGRRGCTYKEFLACNPKEYDGKGGVVVYTRWIEKMKSVQDISWKLSYRITPWSGLAMLRILIGSMSWLATEPATIQRAVQKAGTLIDEAVRNGSQKKNP
ncbi:hypothetical protein Tco_0426407, partial [Tanacetum coccineum]